MPEKSRKGLGAGLGALFGGEPDEPEKSPEREQPILELPISKVEPRAEQPRCTFDEVALAEAAVRDALGPDSVLLTPQSMGGEDFAWYLTRTPGALLRLGTRTPGGRTYDLHQGDLVVDERAILAGASVFCAIAARALAEDAG